MARSERRTKEGYQLRVYIDAIKAVEAMSDDAWTTAWAENPDSDGYFSRSEWLDYLQACALRAADIHTRKAA